MKKNLRSFMATMMALTMVIAMTGCGSEPSTSREETTTTVTTTTESSPKEETVTEPVVQEPETQEAETQEPVVTETPTFEGPVEFTIATVGGMYFDEAIMNAASENGGYDYLFEDAKPYLESADVTLGVIQTPLKDKEAYNIAKAIKNAGFDVINVATTNVTDNGEVDFNATLGNPHTNHMEVCGATSEINPYNKIAIIEVQGVKVAFIAGAEGATSVEGSYEINTIDEDLIISQIEEAKSEGAMVIVVSLNYVDNGQDSLDSDKEAFFNRLGSAGAHIVLCSGIDKLIIHQKTMDIGNGIYGMFLASQGSFLSSDTNSSTIFRIKVRIDETGFVDAFSESLGVKVFYPDASYRLIPVAGSDLENGDYPADFKETAEHLYRTYKEIIQ